MYKVWMRDHSSPVWECVGEYPTEGEAMRRAAQCQDGYRGQVMVNVVGSWKPV